MVMAQGPLRRRAPSLTPGRNGVTARADRKRSCAHCRRRQIGPGSSTAREETTFLDGSVLHLLRVRRSGSCSGRPFVCFLLVVSVGWTVRPRGRVAQINGRGGASIDIVF